MAKLIATGEKDKSVQIQMNNFSHLPSFIHGHFLFQTKRAAKGQAIGLWVERRNQRVIRRKGLEKVTVEELVGEITPKGRGINLLIVEYL